MYQYGEIITFWGKKNHINSSHKTEKIKKKALGIISKAALANARKEVNSACVLFGYQPKMPKDLKQQIKGEQS